jgi:hypothetical protein
MLRTTDPKDIGILYLATAFFFFLAGGAMALLMRGELAVPGTHRSSCPRGSTISWSPCTDGDAAAARHTDPFRLRQLHRGRRTHR